MGKRERKNQTPNDININKEDEETTTTATHQMSERAQAKRAMKNT